MEFLKQHVFHFFGIAVAIAGLVGMYRGKLTFSFEGSEESSRRTLEGRWARVLSVGYVLAGLSFFLIGPGFGIAIALALMFLTWLVGKSTN